MSEERLKPGDTVRHFKSNEDGSSKLYTIACFGTHTETMEKMVVYSDISNGQVWIRPYETFMGKVDKDKYPDCKQEYRFELVP